MDNKTQFTGKAQFYNSRPTYPDECINYLINKLDLNSNSVIADIGAGTGILSKPFLDIGCSVYDVEPNEDMFFELKNTLSQYQNAIFLKTSAERTDIPDYSCDAVVVGTAFHWFDKDKFHEECRRILKNNKYVAILRISNNSEADKELDKIRHYSEQDLNDAKSFFGEGYIDHTCFEYTQIFDEERFINHLLSSATAPLPNDENFEGYVNKCRGVFKKCFENELAELPFAVNCYVGRVDT